MTPDPNPCPCGSGKALDHCCGPVIDGRRLADSAETQMRSRYTAFSLKKANWLLQSWHPKTRPAEITFNDKQHWTRLKILDSGENHVEFVATCKIDGKAHKLREKSRFILENGNWFYVGAVTSD